MTHIQVFVTLGMLIFLAACKGSLDGAQWVKDTHDARENVLAAIPEAPYQQKQHDALKNYFEKSEELLQLFALDEKNAEGFNEFVQAQDLNEICLSTLLPPGAWPQAMRNCKKNRYFLCTEAVRRYPCNVRSLRDSLQPDNRKRFDESPACRQATEDFREGDYSGC